jgi:hypothetical protein
MSICLMRDGMIRMSRVNLMTKRFITQITAHLLSIFKWREIYTTFISAQCESDF